jgi:sugar O-acyltransferase (sialic acid O-acetyltransferase NeuD family)
VSRRRVVILLGGGGHAAVVADAALARGWEVAGFLSDSAGNVREGSLTRLGSLADLAAVVGRRAVDDGAILLHAAVGDAELRRRWLDLASDWPTDPIVHPSAVVSPSAMIGPGVFVGPLAVVNAGAVLDRGVIVNSGAVIEHDCRVGAFAHVAPGAVLTGAAIVGEGSLIGARAVVLPGMVVGRGATVGAGAVVIEPVPDGVVARGTPARWDSARQ